jgi:hypothetical protein
VGIVKTNKMNDILQTSLTVLGSIGGIETIKWFFSRKTNKRVAEADADIAEVKAENIEFDALNKRIEVLGAQLLQQNEQYGEQTQYLRDIQRQLLETTVENGKLKAEIATLKAERAMKLCERRGCADRQPQSGY